MKKFVRTEVLFEPKPENGMLGIERDVYRDEQGKETRIAKYTLPDCAIIAPFTENLTLLAIVEEREGFVPKPKLIGETAEGNEEPQETARRGLLEEAGYEGELTLLASIYENTGKGKRVNRFWVARHCKRTGNAEAGIRLSLIQPLEFRNWIRNRILGKPLTPQDGVNSFICIELALEHLGLITLQR